MRPMKRRSALRSTRDHGQSSDWKYVSRKSASSSRSRRYAATVCALSCRPSAISRRKTLIDALGFGWGESELMIAHPILKVFTRARNGLLTTQSFVTHVFLQWIEQTKV